MTHFKFRKNMSRLMHKLIIFISFVFISSSDFAQQESNPFILILGTAQDGGYPHIGCTKEHCAIAWEHDSLARNVVSLAVVDPVNKKWYLFEATPDISKQLRLFSQLTDHTYNFLPDGIFLTHAHIGHYTGLMEFGREALSTKGVQVYAMPRMKQYLETNGPWSQLVNLKNIELHEMTADSIIALTEHISIKPFLVPHRDEYSETAGYKISTSAKTYLFIPDINKWETFDKNIVEEVRQCDIAFLDATFYSPDELGRIDIKEVPHPFVIETMELFKNEDALTKSKIWFIHFNHTNPLLWDASKKEEILNAGFHLAEQGMKL